MKKKRVDFVQGVFLVTIEEPAYTFVFQSSIYTNVAILTTVSKNSFQNVCLN